MFDDYDEFTGDDRDEESLQRLVTVERFGSQLGHVPWFTHVGQPLLAEEQRTARAYLDALGFGDADIVPVRDWDEAAYAAENPGLDTEHWDTEEQLRAALTTEALEFIDERELSLALTRVSQRAGEAVKAGTQEAAALGDVGDEALLLAAAGAAAQAAYNRALADAAGADADHPFRLKFALFATGRWPIAVIGGTFHLF